MGLTVSKADSAPPPMPDFIKTSPVLSKVAEDLKVSVLAVCLLLACYC
jgi:hypothetical protein